MNLDFPSPQPARPPRDHSRAPSLEARPLVKNGFACSKSMPGPGRTRQPTLQSGKSNLSISKQITSAKLVSSVQKANRYSTVPNSAQFRPTAHNQSPLPPPPKLPSTLPKAYNPLSALQAIRKRGTIHVDSKRTT